MGLGSVMVSVRAVSSNPMRFSSSAYTFLTFFFCFLKYLVKQLRQGQRFIFFAFLLKILSNHQKICSQQPHDPDKHNNIQINFNLCNNLKQQFSLYLMHLLIITALVLSVAANTCHYSCATCTGQEYVSCLSCPSGSFVETVEDPTVMPSQYWSSVYPSGTCVATFAPEANALGIIFFLIIVGVCLFFRTKQSFYLLITFQTYGLYNLIEIAWVNPIGYVLQGFQYLMIFNTVGYGYKTEDYLLVASKNYRLNKYLQTTSIAQNLALIAAFTLIPLILLIVISVISLRKQKTAAGGNQDDVIFESISGKSSKREVMESQTAEDREQCCYCWKDFSQTYLIPVAKFLLCFMFLMVQQTCLVLLVSLVYVTPVQAGIIILCVIYLHILVFVMSYSYYYRIEYFKTKKIMYISFAKKIVLPVMVVVPIQYQYVFFIFAAAFLVLEFIFDNMNGLYKKFNRMAVYKVVEMVTVLLLFIYYIVERSAKSYSSSRAAAITCTFVMVVNLFIFVCVELPISIKQKYFGSKVEENQMISVSQNKEKIMQEDTLDNIQKDYDKDKDGLNNVLIIDNVEDKDSRGLGDDKNGDLGIDIVGDGRNGTKSQDGDSKNGMNRVSMERQESLTKDDNSSIKEKQGDGNGLLDEANNNDRNSNDGGSNDGKEKEQELDKIEGQGDDDDQNGPNGRKRNKKNQGEEQASEQKQPPKPKKRRRQIIDPQLRMRYGI